MGHLDDILKLPASTRRLRLQQGGARKAIVELGASEGVAWLEKHLESPIGPHWGRLLFALKPGWGVLERWMQISKLHCLTAIDVLDRYCGKEHDENAVPELPHGAVPEAIHIALDCAIQTYGNPRLNDKAKRIKHVFPVGSNAGTQVSIPNEVLAIANNIFQGESTLELQWRESLQKAMAPPASLREFWFSLLAFLDCSNMAAIVDWKDVPAVLVEQLSVLTQWPEALSINLTGPDTLESALIEVGVALKIHRRELVALGDGSDAYVLSILPPALAEGVALQLESLFSGEPEFRLTRF